jgi:hypothetical protein
VFSFAYAQTVPITTISRSPELEAGIDVLRRAGYREIVLVTHSAGGLVARQFIEEHPDCGVTKVVQVQAPNTGSEWAELKDGVRAVQRPFVDSLRCSARRAWHEQSWKPLPAHVQFVCLVGNSFGFGDGTVSTASQWPEDLRRQGVPAVVVPLGHTVMIFGHLGPKIISRLVREDQPRWCPDQVEELRQRLHLHE